MEASSALDGALGGGPPIDVGDKLYLVVRADLPAGAQAVQAAHALREFAAHHPEVDRAWYERSNYLALLSVPDEGALQRLLTRARERGLLAAPFHEPDRHNEMTALALEPAGQRLVRNLPLALTGRPPKDRVGPPQNTHSP